MNSKTMGSISEIAVDDKRLLARVDDALRLCRKRQSPSFVGFLDERQAVLVKNRVSRVVDVECRFFGGHPQAERVMLGVFGQSNECDEEVFPLTAIAFFFRREASLTHRDVLGSLLGCGIVREKIGDILCAEGFAVVFVAEELAEFLVQAVTKIGREGVRSEYPFQGELPLVHAFEPIVGTVASARLDAVLKAILGGSREQACRLIQSAMVSINHQPVSSVSANVKAGDCLSIRGKGRFVIDGVSDLTKKGRLVLRARKYV